MGILELLILAVGVSMDAFAVSICRGVQLKKVKIKHSLEVGIYFGGFQATMPVIGYLVGSRFYNVIKNLDHHIVLLLLGIMGIKMIQEALNSSEEEKQAQSLFLLAIATSIDALAVGVSFALFQINIIVASSLIGVIALSTKYSVIQGSPIAFTQGDTKGRVENLMNMKIMKKGVIILLV